MTKQETDKEIQEIVEEITENSSDTDNLELQLQNLEKQLNKKELELSEMQDKFLRILAEKENMHKRHEIELQDKQNYCMANFAKDISEVLENLYRAIENLTPEIIKIAPAIENTYQGLEITKKDMITRMEKHGLKRINPNPGEEFDHNFHQLVGYEQSDEYPNNTIYKVLQAGYLLKDRLLRPAIVIVVQ